MAAEDQDWEMHRHDYKKLVVTAKDSAGSVVSLVGAQEITFAASRKRADGFSSTAALTKKLSNGSSEVEITDGANGEASIYIESSDTDGMSGEYYYEVEVIDANGKPATVTTGVITIHKDLILQA